MTKVRYFHPDRNEIPERIRKTIERPHVPKKVRPASVDHAKVAEELRLKELKVDEDLRRSNADTQATLRRVADDIFAGVHKWNIHRKPTQKKFDEWYRERTKRWERLPRKGRRAPSIGDDVRDAEDWFKCKGLRPFARDARGRLAPEDWKKSGAKGPHRAPAKPKRR